MSLALSVSDYLKLQTSQTWLIKPLLPVGGTMLLYGDPKVGKSFAALQLAQALTGNRGDFLGFEAPRTPAPVVYVQLDTPRSLWQERLADLTSRGQTFDQLFLSDRESLDTWPFDILKFEHYSLLKDLVSTYKPGTVFVDTLKETSRVEENRAELQQLVVQSIRAAVQPAALVLIHHAKKPMDEHVPDLLGDIRGSSYLAGAVDTIMRLTASGLYYVGRAAEGGVVKTRRASSGLWEVETYGAPSQAGGDSQAAWPNTPAAEPLISVDLEQMKVEAEAWNKLILESET